VRGKFRTLAEVARSARMIAVVIILVMRKMAGMM